MAEMIDYGSAFAENGYEEGDLVYDSTWESFSQVITATEEKVVLRPNTWLGQENTGGQTTEHTPQELDDASHLLHYPKNSVAYVGLKLTEDVKGVGDSVAVNLDNELTYQEFKLGCKEAHKHGQTERLELADGVGAKTAERIAEYVITNGL